MAQEKEAIHEVGIFRFEVFGSDRRNRYTSSKFNLRCDAIGLHEREILLLSVIGPETSVKALTAGLRSSGKDQKRIEYSASVGCVESRDLGRCSDGYRVYRTKLDYDQWHLLFPAKRAGFMPVLTDEALWRHLQGEQFTTPLLREWISWLKTALQRRELLVRLDQSGCPAGVIPSSSTPNGGFGLRRRLVGCFGRVFRESRNCSKSLRAIRQRGLILPGPRTSMARRC